MITIVSKAETDLKSDFNVNKQKQTEILISVKHANLSDISEVFIFMLSLLIHNVFHINQSISESHTKQLSQVYSNTHEHSSMNP